MKQHKADVESKKLDEHISGISKHARSCTTGHIDWENPKIIAIFQEKKNLQLNLSIRESLEIRKQDSTNHCYNDPQMAMKSKAWDPLLKKIKNQRMILKDKKEDN